MPGLGTKQCPGISTKTWCPFTLYNSWHQLGQDPFVLLRAHLSDLTVPPSTAMSEGPGCVGGLGLPATSWEWDRELVSSGHRSQLCKLGLCRHPQSVHPQERRGQLHGSAWNEDSSSLCALTPRQEARWHCLPGDLPTSPWSAEEGYRHRPGNAAEDRVRGGP